jgi:hypothetical protein
MANRTEKQAGVAEGESNTMANTASRLANKDDGKVAKLRVAGDKRREEQLKGRDIAKRDRTSKDEWDDLLPVVAEGVYRGDWVRHPDNPWQIGQIQSIDNGQAAVIWKKTDKRKRAQSSTHPVNDLQHARREFSQLTQPTHTPGMAEGKVKLHTDPGYFGAEVDDAGFDSLPVVNISADRLVGFEPDSKMQQPKSQANVKKIVAGLKKGDKLPPLLVRKYKNGYQVLDGHHRFWAYKLSGTKSIPVRIVADKDIEEISKSGVAEGTELPGDFKLMGQNLFLKNLARNLQQRYPAATVKLSSDRVTAHHNEGDDEALSVMGTEVMDSGYIGVGLDDAFTESFQGVLVPTIKQTTEQLLAANPGMQPALFLSTDNWNPDAWTHIADKLGYRLVADDESLDENFADGKNPGRKGLSKRVGVNTKASVSSLRNTAKHSSGEKQRMAHWLANMKAGRAKAKK